MNANAKETTQSMSVQDSSQHFALKGNVVESSQPSDSHRMEYTQV